MFSTLCIEEKTLQWKAISLSFSTDVTSILFFKMIHGEERKKDLVNNDVKMAPKKDAPFSRV